MPCTTFTRTTTATAATTAAAAAAAPPAGDTNSNRLPAEHHDEFSSNAALDSSINYLDNSNSARPRTRQRSILESVYTQENSTNTLSTSWQMKALVLLCMLSLPGNSLRWLHCMEKLNMCVRYSWLSLPGSNSGYAENCAKTSKSNFVSLERIVSLSVLPFVV
ncbi:hypothetical protein BD408DRAFT_422904 [Parasitella parasitica]|nr:hypothetical protein BD408DRAFT_422904 [Parasitella parasitica]